MRTIVVIDNDGKVIKGIRIYQGPNESKRGFYKALASEIHLLKKEYPGMRIQDSTCPDISAMRYVFPELFGPRTS